MQLEAGQCVVFFLSNVQLKAAVFKDNQVVGEIEDVPQIISNGTIKSFIKAEAAKYGLAAVAPRHDNTFNLM